MGRQRVGIGLVFGLLIVAVGTIQGHAGSLFDVTVTRAQVYTTEPSLVTTMTGQWAAIALAGYRFLLIEIRVTNRGSLPLGINDLNWHLEIDRCHDTTRPCEVAVLAVLNGLESYLPIQACPPEVEVPPGGTLTCGIGFDIPVGTHMATLQYAGIDSVVQAQHKFRIGSAPGEGY